MSRETGESQAEGEDPGGSRLGPGVLARGPRRAGAPGPRRPGYDLNEIRPNQIQASIESPLAWIESTPGLSPKSLPAASRGMALPCTGL